MDIPSDLFPWTWLWTANGLFVVVLYRALRAVPWTRLRAPETLHVFLGACVATMVLWSLKAGITPGLNFHLLGVTTLTLMFGWPLAMMGVSLALLGITLNGGGGWESFALNGLLMGVVPISVTQVLLQFAQGRLPYNFFIYVFLNAFCAAGLAGLCTGLTTAGLMVFGQIHSLERLAYEYLPYFPLMFFPEAVFNGMLMTTLVGLRPTWVCSFDDDRYLKGK